MAKPLDNQSVPLALRVKAADAALEYVNALTLATNAQRRYRACDTSGYRESLEDALALRDTAENALREACMSLADACHLAS